MLLNEVDVLLAVLRQILILFDASDVCFPAVEHFKHRLALFKNLSRREIVDNLALVLVTCADRYLVKITQHVDNRERNICCALDTAAVSCCNAVEPTHSSRSVSCCAVLSAVAAALAKLLSLVAEISETNAPAPTAEE